MKKITFWVALSWLTLSGSAQSSEYYSGILDLNNVSARIFQRNVQFFHENSIGTRFFNYPANSGKSMLFSFALWIGGKSDDVLYLAADKYNQVGWDFQTGPLTADGTASYVADPDRDYNRVWEVDSAMIKNHLLHYLDAGYFMPEAIATWPAHGDTAVGHAYNLAPFQDLNMNGRYDLENGDVPEICGNKTIFFILNDQRVHSETGGLPVGLELHVFAYAFDRPELHQAFENTLFYKYRIINRSDRTYSDTYVSQFTDFDIGSFNDDFMGCNVKNSTMFAYNGISTDAIYGENPPAQGAVFLGVAMDQDGYDNPSWSENNSLAPHFNGDCEMLTLDGQLYDFTVGGSSISSLVKAEAINGYYFGDGIPDNERLGMTNFMAFVAGPSSDPSTPAEYYNCMRSYWKDGSPLKFRGTGDITRFAFPGESDSCHWGTAGVDQGSIWNEATAGNMPGDRKGVASSGPFTMLPGTTYAFDIAHVSAPI